MLLRRSSLFLPLAVTFALLCPPLLTAQEKKTPPPGKAVATIDGTPISEEELDRAAAAGLDELEIQRQQFEANLVRKKHQILEEALTRLVDEKIFAAEAARQGITTEELLKKEVNDKLKDPAPEEVDRFYEANKNRVRLPKEQLTAQIIQYLKKQSYDKLRDQYLESLKKDRKIEIYLQPLRTDVAVAGYPSRGPENAPVTIVEFSDFQCPFCKNFTSTLNLITKEFPSSVRIVFRQFPLSQIHPMAEKAAEASLCARDQGKFWELHDLMFSDQADLKVEDLKKKAGELGLNADAFNACLDSGKYADEIRKDTQEGAALGISGTPAAFINGRFLSGAQPYDKVVSIIKEELEKKNAKP